MEGTSESEASTAQRDSEPVDDDYEEDNEEFFFESDHLALRGNADYRSVLRTIVVLEAQRIEATKHIDLITEAERIALNDPEAFVHKLRSGENLNLPGRINIQNVRASREPLANHKYTRLNYFDTSQLPKVKFEKYNVTMPSVEPKDETGSSGAKDAAANNDLTVRGRTFDQTKPETFNQVPCLFQTHVLVFAQMFK